MTPFSLYPAFVRMSYRTRFAAHTQTIPLYGWNPPSGGHPIGTFLGADSLQYDAEAYLLAYTVVAAPLWPDTTTIDNFTIYTMAAPTGEAIPVAGKNVAVVGTNDNDGWDEAVQLTFTLRTDLFHKAKYVYLDVPSDNDFNKYTSITGLSSVYTDLIDFYTDPTGCFCGRDRGKPSVFVSLIHDLNDKLRQEYGLG